MLDHLMALLGNPNIKRMFFSTIAVMVIFFIGYLARASTRRYVEDSGTRFRVRKWINNFTYILSFFVLLAIYSDQLGGLAIFLGGVGVGIAFALQEVIASFAGWMAATLGNFYRPGDRVQLGGIKGDVIDISVLRTTLMEIGEWVDADLYTGRIVRIANSFVFKEPVFNYSSKFPYLWDEIKIPIRHGSDFVLTRALLDKAAHEITAPIISEASDSWREVKRSYFLDKATMEPKVTMKITDNWLEFTVHYIVGHRNRRLIKDQIFTRILEEITQYPERITIASTTIALVETPSIHIKMDNS